MMAVGVVLVRRVFVVFGAIGSCGYIGHFAYDVFKESVLFPIVLTAIGLGIIYIGIVWQKYEQTITQYLRRLLPTLLKELLEKVH